MGRSVLLAAGGTAGHLLPAQALGLQLKSLGVDLLFSGVGLSQNRFFDSTLFPHKEVAGAPPFSKGVLSKAKAYLKLGLGVFEAIGILQKFRPQIVVGFGSFHSAPLILAALLLDTPYLLVESNGLPGKVNRFFARRAFSIALQFSEAAPRLKGKSRVVEMPIWSKISMGNREVSVKEARDHFGLREERETLLVFGGSQGANPISRAVANLSFQREVQVIHLCGEGGSVEEWRAIWKSRGILACVKPFEKEMDLAWRAADLAICRAGGGTIAEAIATATATILVPWPKSADGHQEKNGEILVQSGGALMLQEEHLGDLSQKVEEAFQHREAIANKLKSINAIERERLVDVVLQMIGRGA